MESCGFRCSQQELTHTTVGDVAWVLNPQRKPPAKLSKLVLVTINIIGWRTAYRNKGIWLLAMNGPFGPTQTNFFLSVSPAIMVAASSLSLTAAWLLTSAAAQP